MKLGKNKHNSDSRSPGRQRRTDTSWGRPAAFSYHAQRSERDDAAGRQQPSLAQKRGRLLSLQFWMRRSGLLIAVIAALICLISIVSLSTRPRIVLLDAENNQAAFHTAEAYQREAAKQLSSSIWNRNKITVNTGAASAYMQQKFPELQQVSITLPLMGHRPIYYLRANAPAFVLQSINGSYVLDADGKALLPKDTASPQTLTGLPVIADQTGASVQLGKQVLSGQKTRFIQTVVDTLAAKHNTVESLTLPPNTVNELDVKIAGQPYVIKFNMHDDTARQQTGTYLALMNTLAGQRVTPAQYVDVRVAGRAYYQ